MDYYSILSLPSPITSQATQSVGIDEIRRAYRQALLKHHPDKSSTGPAHVTTHGPTIDAIKHAYEVLSDPKTRADHDKELLRRPTEHVGSQEKISTFRTGSDHLDLDDMTFDENSNEWTYSCRCGDRRGFVLAEPQLEVAAANGGSEVMISCAGCSLWLKVAFGVHDDEEQHVEGSV